MPVIAPGCHDTASAVAAVPAETPERLVLHQLRHVVPHGRRTAEAPIVSAKALQYNYTNEIGVGEMGVGSSVRFLKNIMGLWLVQECRRALAEAGERPRLRRNDRNGRPGRTAFGPLIDPDHARS